MPETNSSDPLFNLRPSNGVKAPGLGLDLRIRVDLGSIRGLPHNPYAEVDFSALSPSKLSSSLFESSYFGKESKSSYQGGVTMMEVPSPRICEANPLIGLGEPFGPISVSTPRGDISPKDDLESSATIVHTPSLSSDQNPPDFEGLINMAMVPLSGTETLDLGMDGFSASYPQQRQAKKMKLNSGEARLVQRVQGQPAPSTTRSVSPRMDGVPGLAPPSSEDESDSRSRASSLEATAFNMKMLKVPPLDATTPKAGSGMQIPGLNRRHSWNVPARVRRSPVDKCSSRNRQSRSAGRLRIFVPAPPSQPSSRHSSAASSPSSEPMPRMPLPPATRIPRMPLRFPVPSLPLPPGPAFRASASFILNVPTMPPVPSHVLRRRSDTDAQPGSWKGMGIPAGPPNTYSLAAALAGDDSDSASERPYRPPQAIARKKTDVACVHCVRAKAGCDRGRPCARCKRLGKTNCVDRPVQAKKPQKDRRRLIRDRKRRFSAPEHRNLAQERRFHNLLSGAPAAPPAHLGGGSGGNLPPQWRQPFNPSGLESFSLPMAMPSPKTSPMLPPQIKNERLAIKHEYPARGPVALPPPISSNGRQMLGVGNAPATIGRTKAVWRDYFATPRPAHTEESKAMAAALLASLSDAGLGPQLHRALLQEVGITGREVSLCHTVQALKAGAPGDVGDRMQLVYTFDYSYIEKARAVQYFVTANSLFGAATGGQVSANVMSARWFTDETWAAHLTEFLNAHTRAVNGSHTWVSPVMICGRRYNAESTLTFAPGAHGNGKRTRMKSWVVSMRAGR